MKIYVEGGSKGMLNASCRKGFRALIQKALPSGCRLNFEVVPCGSRTAAFHNFRTAMSNGETDAILLVDSEDVVTRLDPITHCAIDPWQHVATCSAPLTPRPARAHNNQIHLMAVSMETWLVADRTRLAAYYGKDFQADALPTHTQLEAVTKPALNNSLAQATRRTTKGEYSKGSHSFAILATLNPAVLEQRLPHAKRFFDFLRGYC